jgi:hypothetical protein
VLRRWAFVSRKEMCTSFHEPGGRNIVRSRWGWERKTHRAHHTVALSHGDTVVITFYIVSASYNYCGVPCRSHGRVMASSEEGGVSRCVLTSQSPFPNGYCCLTWPIEARTALRHARNAVLTARTRLMQCSHVYVPFHGVAALDTDPHLPEGCISCFPARCRELWPPSTVAQICLQSFASKSCRTGQGQVQGHRWVLSPGS